MRSMVLDCPEDKAIISAVTREMTVVVLSRSLNTRKKWVLMCLYAHRLLAFELCYSLSEEVKICRPMDVGLYKIQSHLQPLIGS